MPNKIYLTGSILIQVEKASVNSRTSFHIRRYSRSDVHSGPSRIYREQRGEKGNYVEQSETYPMGNI